MRIIYHYLFISILLCIATSGIAKPLPASWTHNVSMMAVLSPSPNTSISFSYSYKVSFTIKNTGTSDENTFKVIAVITKRNDTVVYRDTMTIPALSSGMSLDTNFAKSFVAKYKQQIFDIVIVATLPNDEYSSDDTIRSYDATKALSDVITTQLIYPSQDSTIQEKTGFNAKGAFYNNCSKDLYDVPVRVQIRKFSNQILVFQADPSIEYLYMEDTAVAIFPSAQSQYDTKTLPVGKYIIALIARQNDDKDRTNDTVFRTFNIIPKNLNATVGIDQTIFPKLNGNLPIDTLLRLSVIVRNDGYTNQYIIPVRAQVTNTANEIVFVDSITCSLLCGATTQVFFRPYVFPAGIYSVKFITTLASDEYRYDDTMAVNFTVGFNQDVKTVSIDSLSPYQNLPPNKPINVIATFRWTGYGEQAEPLMATATITSDLTEETVFSNQQQVSPGNFNGSNRATVIFASPLFNSTILPEGYYTLIIRGSVRNGPPADKKSIHFQIGKAHFVNDLELVQISPADKVQLYKGDSTTITATYHNAGSNTITEAKLIATLRSSSGSIKYADTITKLNIAPGTVQTISFRHLMLPTSDNLTLQVIANATSDENHTNDTISHAISTFHPDIAVAKIVAPKPNQQIKQGTLFNTIGSFFLSHSLTDIVYQNVQIQIINAAADTIFATGYTAIPILYPNGLEQTKTFPSSMTGLDFSTIPIGVYRMKVIVSMQDDNNQSNDTATTNFSVVESLAVKEPEMESSFAIYPNPSTGVSTMTYINLAPSRLKIRVMNTLGVPVYSTESNEYSCTTSITMPLQDQPAGIYVCECTIADNQGEVRKLRRNLIVTK